MRRWVLLTLATFLLAACSSGAANPQAGPNDRTACQALDVIYANNGADPSDTRQAQIMSGAGLVAENPQLRSATQTLVADGRRNDQSAVRTDMGIVAGICAQMGIGPQK